MIVIPNTQKRKPVPEKIQRRDRILNHRPRESDQEPVLNHTSHIHSQSRGLPNKEKHSKVQRERANGIGPEDNEIEMETRSLSKNRKLHKDPRNRQENETARSDVVKRRYRV